MWCANGSRLYKFTNFAEVWVKSAVKAYLQLNTRCFNCCEGFFCFFYGKTYGFLTKYMFSGGGRFFNQTCMSSGGGTDKYSIDLRVIQNILVISSQYFDMFFLCPVF